MPDRCMGRAEPAVELRQWTVGTVMGVAPEHGLLSRSGRFLALWTAYGGVPEYWERFVKGADGDRPRDFLMLDGDDVWWQGFLKEQLRLLYGSSERFDSRAVVTLAPNLRRVELMVGRRPGRGLTSAEIVEAIRKDAEPDELDAGRIDGGLGTLRKHPELMVVSKPFMNDTSESPEGLRSAPEPGRSGR